MPSIKSSSKGTTKLTLFATEQRTLSSAAQVCQWLAAHGEPAVASESQAAAEAIRRVLSRMVAETSKITT